MFQGNSPELREHGLIPLQLLEALPASLPDKSWSRATFVFSTNRRKHLLALKQDGGVFTTQGSVICLGFEQIPDSEMNVQGRIFPLFFNICSMSKEISVPDPQTRKDELIMPILATETNAGLAQGATGGSGGSGQGCSWHHPNQSVLFGGPLPSP